MANFDQKVTIKIDVDAQSLGDISEAIVELESAHRGLQTLDTDLDDLGDSFSGLADVMDENQGSFDNFMSTMGGDSLNEQADALHNIADAGERVGEAKKNVSDANRLMGKSADDGKVSLNDEARSLDNLMGKADTAAEAKDAFRKSNGLLSQQINDESIESLRKEHDAMMGIRSMGGDNDTIKRWARSNTDLSVSAQKASNKFRRLRHSVGETRESFRAANKVGDLFEDGLGSMSVNLGAFTVALRNFLTQVPLLLGALGSLGSAAIGVAGAFITAGAAIGSAIGAGALAMAQGLDEQYQEIEGTGQALQVMMLGLKDTFVEAVSPLTENEEVIHVFRQFVVGLAEDISLVADTFSELMTRQDSWKDGVLGISGLMDELGERLEEPFRELVSALTFMFVNLQDEFMDMTVAIVDGMTALTRFTTKFTDGITESNKALDAFTDALSEMAKLGSTLFDGLEPIFVAFFNTLESVATMLNEMNGAFVSNAITIALLSAGLSRFAGVMGSVVGLIPNLIFGLKQADGSALSMIKSFASFSKQHGTLFSGFTSLAESIENMGEEMAIMSARSDIAEANLDDMDNELRRNFEAALMTSNSIDEMTEELHESAFAADSTEEAYEELDSALREVGLSARFAEHNLDELDDVDASQTRLSRFGGNASTGAVAGGAAGDAATPDRGVVGKISDKLSDLKGQGVRGALSTIADDVATLSTRLAGLTGKLAIVIAILGGLAVGLIGNLDAVMSKLSATAEALGATLKWMGGQIMDIFIATWNAIWDLLVGVWAMLRPFIDMLRTLGGVLAMVFEVFAGEGEDATGPIEIIAGILEWVVDVVILAINAIGALGRIINTVVGTYFSLWAAGAKAVGFVLQFVIHEIGQLVNSLPILNSAVEGTIGFFGWLFNVIQALPEVASGALDRMVQFFQDSFNTVIDVINGFVDGFNNLPGISIEKLNRLDFATSGDDGARVDREEFEEDSDELMDGFAGERSNNITYNEDNSTNIDQTVNADPEDQAQLSRVVTDAIAEANSFERRRQGGQ